VSSSEHHADRCHSRVCPSNSVASKDYDAYLCCIACRFCFSFLQVLIIATGNYNFFNFLTVLLCCAVLARDNADSDSICGGDEAIEDPALESVGYFVWARINLRRLEQARWWRRLWICASFAFTAVCSYYMFSIGALTKRGSVVSEDAPWWLSYHLRLGFTVAQHNAWLSRYLPYALGAGFMGLVVSCMTYLEDSLRSGGRVGKGLRGLWALLVSAVALAVFSCTLCTFISIDQSLQSSLPEWSRRIFSEMQARHLAISSPYGLFRRMTGVGETTYDKWCVLLLTLRTVMHCMCWSVVCYQASSSVCCCSP
jgi:hypothetical protein